jgi:hypothetical protein
MPQRTLVRVPLHVTSVVFGKFGMLAMFGLFGLFVRLVRLAMLAMLAMFVMLVGLAFLIGLVRFASLVRFMIHGHTAMTVRALMTAVNPVSIPLCVLVKLAMFVRLMKLVIFVRLVNLVMLVRLAMGPRALMATANLVSIERCRRSTLVTLVTFATHATLMGTAVHPRNLVARLIPAAFALRRSISDHKSSAHRPLNCALQCAAHTETTATLCSTTHGLPPSQLCVADHRCTPPTVRTCTYVMRPPTLSLPSRDTPNRVTRHRVRLWRLHAAVNPTTTAVTWIAITSSTSTSSRTRHHSRDLARHHAGNPLTLRTLTNRRRATTSGASDMTTPPCVRTMCGETRMCMSHHRTVVRRISRGPRQYKGVCMPFHHRQHCSPTLALRCRSPRW